MIHCQPAQLATSGPSPGQRIQVGLPHAGKIAEVTMESDTYQITVDPGSSSPRPVLPAGTSSGIKPRTTNRANLLRSR